MQKYVLGAAAVLLLAALIIVSLYYSSLDEIAVSPTSSRVAACQHPDVQDSSEICAQWTAVAAAEAGLRVSRVSLFWNIFGYLGLLATLLATAWSARSSAAAARAAEESLSHARDLARLELRAYVAIDDPQLAMNADGDTETKFCLTATVEFRNFGATPASDFRYRIETKICDENPGYDCLTEAFSGTAAFIAQHDFHGCVMQFLMAKAELPKIKQGETNLYLVLDFTYKDVFGASHRGEHILQATPEMTWSGCPFFQDDLGPAEEETVEAAPGPFSPDTEPDTPSS